MTVPRDVFARPGILDKAREIASSQEGFAMPGPSREDLLALLG